MYAGSRMIEPPVLSLRPAMVLLNNVHYPNVVLPARVTYHIRQFFNALDLVVEDVSDDETGKDDREDDQDSDSPNAESESLDLYQPEASGIQKSPEVIKAAEGKVSEEVYIPLQQAQTADEGNLINFDLIEFFGSEYLSFLDSSEPHQTSKHKALCGHPIQQRIWKPTSSIHCRRTTTHIPYSHPYPKKENSSL